MEAASSKPEQIPTLSAAKTSKLSLFVKSPFWWQSGRFPQFTPTFCFSVTATSKLTTLTVESLWTAAIDAVKHLCDC